MLFSQLPPNMPMQLLGPPLQGPAEVKQLQMALKNLSVATQRPDIDPGAADGVVGAQTVQAVIAAQTLISAELPTTAFITLQAALAAGAMTSKAKEAIAIAAVPLTVAANTAAVKFKKETPSALGPVAGFFGPGWYKKPAGIALILAGLFVGYKLFFSPTKA